MNAVREEGHMPDPDPITTEMLPQEVAALRTTAWGTAGQLAALIRVLIEKRIITAEDLTK